MTNIKDNKMPRISPAHVQVCFFAVDHAATSNSAATVTKVKRIGF